MQNETTETDAQFDFQLDEFYLDLQEDGRNISILSTAEIASRPFPGLRPFKTSEFQLFRGRGGQAEALIQRLKRNRFLAVIGSSGTGKSSLVRAGLIPELFGGSLREAGSKWNIAVCRPGKNPVSNLAIALSSVKGESKNKSLLHQNFETVEPLLNSSLYGLLEVNEFLAEGKTKTDQANLLIIVDQFEEIFRYDRKDLGRENIENHFVDLLLKAASNADSPVYVIITMRSEFLGDCVKYRGLPEAINEGQYLVPGLNRTQLKDVIEGPVKAAGKSIAPGLVELLINELDEAKAKENLDQLPILQHALMRTYQEAVREGATEITYEHYQRIGGMEKALANHAKEKFIQLGDGNENDNLLTKRQEIAKLIFQALTDASTDLKGGRRPTELRNIYAITEAIGATQEDVNKVVDSFRDNETSFIMPPINTDLHDDLIMDISHESLMRNWDLLKQWIEEEVRYGKFYQRLNERREEDGQFIQGTLLSELINWRDCYPRNAAWASRYHNLPKGQNNLAVHEDLYRKNLLFLQHSEEASAAAKDAEKKKILDDAKRQRAEEDRILAERETARKRLLRFLSVALLFSIALGLWAFKERAAADSEREKARASFITAEEQRKRAVNLNAELTQQTQTAEAARDSAKNARDVALKLYAKLDEQTRTLERTNGALAIQTANAEQQRAIAQNKSEELEKRLAESYLHGQKFYVSNTLSTEEKESILSQLLKERLSETIIPDSKVIKMDLLNDVNTAVGAKEKLMDDPVTGLRMVQSVWRRNEKEPVLQEILPGIFKKNIFHSGKIAFSDLDFLTSDLTLCATSENHQRFGFADDNQIIVGKPDNNGGLVFQNFIDAKKEFAKSTGNTKDAPGEAAINAFALANDTSVSFLVNDSNLLKWQGNQSTTMRRLPNLEALELAQFSPDGSVLATVNKRTVLKVWKPNDQKAKSKLAPDTSLTLRGLKNIKHLLVANNAKKILAVFENGYAVYDLGTKQLRQQLERFRYGPAANFTPDGNYLLVSSSSSENTVKVIDSFGRSALLTLASPFEENNLLTQVNEITLLPDWKHLLVNYAEGTYLYERQNDDSVFSQSKFYRQSNPLLNTLTARKFFSFQHNVSTVQPLNDDGVLAFTKDNTAYMYKVEPQSLSLEEYFQKVSPIIDSTFEERKKAGAVNLDQVLASAQKNLLKQAASYYFEIASNGFDQKEDAQKLDTAYKLYVKMLAADTSLSKIGSIKSLITLNERLYTSEQNKYRPDTVALIEYLNRSVKAREELLEFQPDDVQTSERLSLDYWDISWLLNFKGRYTVAIECAKRSGALNPANNGAYTNLALALLLKGDFPAAEEIYRQYKDSTYADRSGTKFKDSFLNDLKEMEKAGLITKDNDPLYKEALRIKTEILKEK